MSEFWVLSINIDNHSLGITIDSHSLGINIELLSGHYYWQSLSKH